MSPNAAPIQGFSPIIGSRPHSLILGSIPGVASLKAQQYYAHPRNAFWPIISDFLHLEPNFDYASRCHALQAAGFALWDVLESCVRPGSLDSAIDKKSEQQIPLLDLLARYPSIHTLLFNGQKSYQVFTRTWQRDLQDKNYQFFALPSTSPANARLSYAEKRTRWFTALQSARARRDDMC